MRDRGEVSKRRLIEGVPAITAEMSASVLTLNSRFNTRVFGKCKNCLRAKLRRTLPIECLLNAIQYSALLIDQGQC